MDVELLSLTSSSSSAEEADKQNDLSAPHDSSLPPGDKSDEDLCPVQPRLVSVEEQHSVITDSMTVTSTDQEKLLLLNKNTELRRVNRELMKLNDEWDKVYQSTTQGLQKQLQSLDLENTAIKHLNERLLLKVEQQQAAKEYYEQELIREMKKSQELQSHIRLLESQLQREDGSVASTQASVSAGMFSANIRGPTCPELSSSQVGRGPSGPGDGPPRGEPGQEVKDLKGQLEALRHQVKIYEDEYQSEHKTHKQTKQENQRLRRKREEMGQQVALLREQLKIYEADFYRERSDKQVLQRLLMKKGPNKEPVLVHRCNNAEQPYERQREEQTHRRRHQIAYKEFN